jgi:hypothetical protein
MFNEKLHCKYVGEPCFYFNKPATIVKDIEGNGYVAPLDGNEGKIPWAWTAISQIMDNGGQFPPNVR